MELKDAQMYWHGVKVAGFGSKYPFTLFVYFCIKKLLTLQALQCIGPGVQWLSFAARLALGYIKKSTVWQDGGILAKTAFCFFWLGFLVGLFFLFFLSSSLQPNPQSHW